MKYLPHKPVDCSKITILYDDREKKPWTFLADRWLMKKKRLRTGDYTIEDMEDLIVIEKKSSLMELLSNLTAANRKRFCRCLGRLSLIPYRAIVVEDNLDHLSYALTTLRNKSACQLTEDSVRYFLARITMTYGIPLLFVGTRNDNIEIVASRLLIEAYTCACLGVKR